MNKIILKKIALSNWSGVSLSVDFSERKTIIKGVNGIGKSSIINAWRWLLTGKVDPFHPSNYELFDNRKPITPDTPEAIVRAIVNIGGFDFDITKKAKALFTRPKGQSEFVKSNTDKYTIAIDDVEYSHTKFNEWITKNICDIDMIPYCIDGLFFTSLCEDDKKKSRKILLNIVGDIDQKSFNGDYSMIQEMMGKYDVESIKEISSKRKNKIDEMITSSQAVLKVYEDDLEKNNTIEDYDAIKKEIDEKNERIKQIDDIFNNDIKAESQKTKEESRIKNEIFELKLQLKDKENEYIKEQEKKLEKYDVMISSINKENEEIEKSNEKKISMRSSLKKEIDVMTESLSDMWDKRLLLLKKRDEIKALKFNGYKCPYCGQDLPEELLDNAKKEFNESKKNQIDEVVKEGRKNNEDMERLKTEIAKLRVDLDECCKLQDVKSTDSIIKEKNDEKNKQIVFAETDSYKKAQEKISELQKDLESITFINHNDLIAEKQNLYQELEDLNRRYGYKPDLEAIRKNVNNTKKKLQEFYKEKAILEGRICSCNEWIEERANIISERVNGKISGCHVQMWSNQRNGEKNPDCLILDSEGVKYGKTNTAKKIHINIEIQKLFCDHFGIELPIFIDECSVLSSFNVPKLESQHVTIFASDDKEIIVSHED